jgi:GSH-dependent disulfide-bond oxidoreductase
MIDLYFAATPNGLKARLFLEEAGLPYRPIPVSLSKGEQFKPEFLVISPNNKIPAIVDHAPADGGAPITLFESGAIMLYLAEKTGRLLPTDVRGRADVLQWLFWQMAGLGPMAGQIGHFNVYAPEKVPYAIDRYTRETNRLYGVLDRRLVDRTFIAGDFSIADIACYPWIVPHQAHGQHLDDFPHLKRWFGTIAARPATLRTYEGVENVYAPKQPSLTEEERRVLFGQGTRATSTDSLSPEGRGSR